MTNNKALVIIPTYNEAGTIEKTVLALLEVFKQIPNWQMGILVVDDTSPDKTYQIVEQLGKKYLNVKLLVNEKKVGLGGAYLKAMEHAFDDLGAEVVFEFDADLSHDQTKIPEFIRKIDEGYDFVMGTRYGKGGSIPANWGLHRKFLSYFGNLIIATIFFNFEIRDWTSGYRAFRQSVYRAIVPSLNSERFFGYTFQVGSLYNTVKQDFKIAQIPYHFKDREVGESKIGPEYIKNILMYIFKIRLLELVNHRLFKFAVVGGVGALVQLTSLQIWRMYFPYQVAYFLSVECAVISNFIFSNYWTFSDRKLKFHQVPIKFIQFNLASAGSILIQQVVALTGEWLLNINQVLFTLPVINLSIDIGTMLAVMGILIGMSWNFFAYNRFIWKKGKAQVSPSKGKKQRKS